MRVEFTAFGQDIISRDLERFSARAVDASPVWRQLIEDIRQSEREQFMSGGQHSGHPWPALKPETIDRKRAKGYDRPEAPLFATEQMYEALTSPSGDAEVVVEPEGFMFRPILDPPAKAVHQTGWGPIPKRRMVDLTEEEKRAMGKRLQHYIVTGELMASF